MRSLLTVSDIFAFVGMLRSGTGQTVLVVEGDSDSLTLSPHTDKSNARIVVGNGRHTVQEVIRLSDEANLNRIVGIADSDIDRYITAKKTFTSPNLVYTEHYDLESDIIFTGDIFDRILHSQLDTDKVDSFLIDHEQNSALASIGRLAAIVGALRIESVKRGYELNVRDLPLGTFLQHNRPAFDISKLAPAILGRSTRPKIDERKLSALIAKFSRRKLFDKNMCCGHDIVRVLAGAATKWWGTKTSPESVARILRAALSRHDLFKMKVFIEIQAWSDKCGAVVWQT